MGGLTWQEVVDEGQLLAGRDDMATQGTLWLQLWLNSVAASWPWPLLQYELRGVPYNTSDGTGIVVGADPYLHTGLDNTTVGQGILKVLDSIYVYNAEKTLRQRVRIRHQLSSPVDSTSPSTFVGIPKSVRVFPKPGSRNAWVLNFEPAPDKNYLLTIPVIALPKAVNDVTTEVPWYPNDETMIVAVAFKVSEFHDGIDAPRTQGFQQRLAGLVAGDRTRYGSVPGTNDVLTLSPTVFRQRDSEQ